MPREARDTATNAPSTSQPQHESTAQSGSTRSATERERPIESGRESNRQQAGGLARRGGQGTAAGGDPFLLMRRMADDMDRLFEQFGFGRLGLGLAPRTSSAFDDDLWSDRPLGSQTAAWMPQVETFRRGNDIVVRADIPGVDKNDVHVDVENDVLTISGERCAESENDRQGFYRSERSYGQFFRAIPLPEGVNPDQCDATFKDGVLEVTLPAPKAEERKAKRIQVK